jgi:hypothetical protein
MAHHDHPRAASGGAAGCTRSAPGRRDNADGRCRQYDRHQPMGLGKAVEQLWFSRRALAMSLDGSGRRAVPVTTT